MEDKVIAVLWTFLSIKSATDKIRCSYSFALFVRSNKSFVSRVMARDVQQTWINQ